MLLYGESTEVQALRLRGIQGGFCIQIHFSYRPLAGYARMLNSRFGSLEGMTVRGVDIEQFFFQQATHDGCHENAVQ